MPTKKEYEFDYLIFIGRMQPFHLGHQAVLDLALEKSQNVIVLIGSANAHRSTRNPWTYEERKDFVNSVFHGGESWFNSRIHVAPLDDFTYNDNAWVIAVKDIVKEITKDAKKIGIIGFNKDYTSYYLKMFPNWNTVSIPTQFGTLNATDIRDQYFQKVPVISDFLPEQIRNKLKAFAFTEEFKWLLKECHYIRDYKWQWSHSPFPPVFVTVDNVVVQSGNILLINRKEPPYAGSLALPGGFLKIDKSVEDSAVDELKEETRIEDKHGEIPPAKLKSWITKQQVFDDPNRSDRGRSITHAFLYELPKVNKLYHVRGDDDAEHAAWYDISSLNPREFMEDHFAIITQLLGLTL